MAKAKAARPRKQQLGQFMTPVPLAHAMVRTLAFDASSRVFEPSLGDGAFLLPLVERLVEVQDAGTRSERFHKVMNENIYGVEIDPRLHNLALTRLEAKFGPLPEGHHLICGDFFKVEHFADFFDFVVGNPPFGGTFDPAIEDQMDRLYGRWGGRKLKKETYSFFIARSLEWLKPGGTICVICSDTFLTINTMAGLRLKLMDTTAPSVERLPAFSEEVNQDTLILRAQKGHSCDRLTIDGKDISRAVIESTANLSWGVDHSTAKFFDGPNLSEVVIASSGMTIGANDLFLREIHNGSVVETSWFEFYDEPITLARELARARLHRISPARQRKVVEQERTGHTIRNVRIVEIPNGPLKIDLPHPDYRHYNKATNDIVYSPPQWVIFWRDEGDAVLTFKKNGRWYLEGVGGKPFFGREGITWGLISSKLNMRYLPPGYILDSGAPCAFLRDGVPPEELWFILGWGMTRLASTILKRVINHTRNIQGKDVERLPYPHWVTPQGKEEAVFLVERMVSEARSGRRFARHDPEFEKLESIFAGS